MCVTDVNVSSYATPAEQCNARIVAEQRTVSRLLKKVESNLLHGYAFEAIHANSPGFDICVSGFGHRSDRLGLGYSSCYGDERIIRERVAIDLKAELRKRAALRNRLAVLSTGGRMQCLRLN